MVLARGSVCSRGAAPPLAFLPLRFAAPPSQPTEAAAEAGFPSARSEGSGAAAPSHFPVDTAPSRTESQSQRWLTHTNTLTPQPTLLLRSLRASEHSAVCFPVYFTVLFFRCFVFRASLQKMCSFYVSRHIMGKVQRISQPASGITGWYFGTFVVCLGVLKQRHARSYIISSFMFFFPSCRWNDDESEFSKKHFSPCASVVLETLSN